MYLLYNLVVWIASPALILWAAVRVSLGRMPGLAQRLGRLPDHRPAGNGPVAWFHAVSLGETKVAGFLAAELRRRVPGLRVVMTSSTRTGFEEARRSAAPGDIVLYPPLDYAPLCRRFLRRLKPDLVLVTETELWPNLFREVKRFGAGLVVVNGRISDRSFGRYRATRFFWRRVLAFPDALFVQSARDAGRFRVMGAPEARVHVSGNIKYAMRPPASPLAEALLPALRDARLGPVLVAGSTMPGEEPFLLDAFHELEREFPRLWMILAPRHPERFASVAAEIRAAGIPIQRRSEWQPGELIAPGVFLLDSTGDLASLYGIATAAFIGGTLVPTGGHNILEPAHFGVPTVIGPSMENFQEIASQFLEARGPGPVPGTDPIHTGAVLPVHDGAVLQVNDARGLVPALGHLFRDPDYARRLGQSAREVALRQSGGLTPLLEELEKRLSPKASAAPHRVVISQPAAAGAGR